MTPRTEFALPCGIDYNARIDGIDGTDGNPMASITIRGLDEATKDQLRLQAARNRRSMEDEARNILRAALVRQATPTPDLGASIRKRFSALGGIDLALPHRGAIREPPKPRRR